MKRTVKNTITVLLAVCMLTVLCSANVFAAGKEPVTYKAYLWADVELLSTTMSEENYFEVTPETSVFESNEVYVVKGAVTVAKRIECGQNVKLVLTDDSELNIDKGIHVTGSLEIYGNGTLKSELARGENQFSNIGINSGETACDIAVHGGQLHLTHGGDAPYFDAGSGSFSQYAGTIVGNSYGGNGIKAGTISVYGGTLQSTSSTRAGITADTVTICDGTLECNGFYGAGVEGKNITINGGDVMAVSGGGAGVGSGEGNISAGVRSYTTSCNSITINGGHVNVRSYSGAGIGSGNSGSCNTITVNNGNVLCRSTYGGSIGSGVGGTCKTLNINGGCLLNYPSQGYAFYGIAAFGDPAGTMPNIGIGKDVTLRYGKTPAELNSNSYFVTSQSKNITSTLKGQIYVAVVPDEYYERANTSTGSFFSDASLAVIVGCGALLLGAAAGLLLGKKLFGAKKQPAPAEDNSGIEKE